MKKLLLFTACLFALTLSAIAKKNKDTKVVIETEYGKIVMLLYANTPKNTANMVKLANEHYYDSTLFHRVIPNFVIQGGDPESKHAKPGQSLGNGDLKYRVPAEINDSNFHKYGALGVARDNTPDKSGSACQFYIVTGRKYAEDELDKISKSTKRTYTPAQREIYKTKGGTPHLDGNYTVFGEVIEGMDVVEKISNEPRDRADRPNKDIRMLSVRVVKKKKFFGLF
ncbi:MAG: peptidylprolyl isomerase [Bacteroidetes bacterium]|nr:peptidylprolyl isomerase [Bacteroidota bacterium]